MVDGLGDPGAWVEVARLDALIARGKLVVRPDGRRIALIWHRDRVFAIANNCPHEGYPLSEGTVQDATGDGACVLTCNWHNWRFDLATGANLANGEPVRTYPVDVRDGAIHLDLTDPPVDAMRAKVMAGLMEAVVDNAYDRVARELARYERLGGDPLDGLAAAVVWSHTRLEFGTTHAYAVAPDWLVLRAEALDPVDRLGALVEAIAHIAEDCERAPEFPFADGAVDWDPDGYLAAIEGGDEATAVRMVRGALGDGLCFADLEATLAKAALAHYADFGHALIYTHKAGELIAALGGRVAEPVLLALARAHINASREDLIPEFRAYAPALEAFGGNDPVPSAEALRGLDVKRALGVIAAAGGGDKRALHAALLTANAVNLLTYDTTWQERTDSGIADNVGWLDFTHGITFGDAVRVICSRHPGLWPAGLLQMACFLGRNSPYVDRTATPVPADPDAVMARALERLRDHGVAEPIIACHLVKTTLAARARIAAGDGDAGLIAAALDRFLSARLKRRHVRRTARQMLDFVAREQG